MRSLLKNKQTAVFTVLVALLFLFPLFKESLSSIFFILLSIAAITLGAPSSQLLHYRRLWFMAIPFVTILIRSIAGFSLNSLQPAKNALFFLLFPIIFSLLPPGAFSRKNITIYLQVLKNCCAAVAIGYIVLFLYYYDYYDFFVYQYKVPRFRDFVYNETPLFRIHPTYFTAMLLPCTAFSMERFKTNARKNFYELIYIAIFVGITFLLVAKISIILILLLIAYGILFRSGLKLWGKLLVFLAGFALCAGFLVTLPGVQNRFQEMIESFSKPPEGNAHDSTNIRRAIISCSTELASDNLLLGVGYSNITGAYSACLEDNYHTDFFVGKSYMSHNYFFYMLVGGGIACLAAFLYFVYMLLRRTAEANNYVLWVTVVSTLIVSLTEDYFYRHFGVYFFCLMCCVLYRGSENMRSLRKGV